MTGVQSGDRVRDALATLLEGFTWGGYFERCCTQSPGKLLAEVGRFRDAVAADGEDYAEEEVRCALLVLAREIHPGSAAALPGGDCACAEAGDPAERDDHGKDDGGATTDDTAEGRAELSVGAATASGDGEKGRTSKGPGEAAVAGRRLRLVEPGGGVADGPPEYPRDFENPGDYRHPEGFGQEVTGAAADGAPVAEEIACVRRALLDLVLSEEQAGAIYEKQCEQGLIGMFGRAKALRLALEERGEHHGQGAVEVAIPELALETHPGSAAAAWERLLARVLRGDVARLDGGGGSGAVGAVLDLAAKEERHFKELTQLALDADGPNEDELLRVARELFAALRRRGRRGEPRGFSDHVWRALNEILPDAPGVRWNAAWADGMLRRAAAHIGERLPPGEYASDLRGVAQAEDEVGAAYVAEDRRRYRRAVGAWVAAVLSPERGSASE